MKIYFCTQDKKIPDNVNNFVAVLNRKTLGYLMTIKKDGEYIYESKLDCSKIWGFDYIVDNNKKNGRISFNESKKEDIAVARVPLKVIGLCACVVTLCITYHIIF